LRSGKLVSRNLFEKKYAYMKTALITGGATRLGRIMALHLATQGYAIALHYNTSEGAAQQTAAEIRALKQRCEIFSQDLTADGAATILFSDIQQKIGIVDVLINNAAIFVRDTLQTLGLQSFLQHQQVNLLSPLLLMRAFAQQENIKNGCIINMLDQKIHRPDSNFLSYTLSKIGLDSATTMLATDFAPHIRVNGIALGAIIPAPTQRESHFNAMRENTPLGIGASVEDVCRALDFLTQSTSITGQIITIDGGAWLR
jgi:NAD(P)-dependent dehydrogenase (short-subunit alcohol dehydrogenase family)